MTKTTHTLLGIHAALLASTCGLPTVLGAALPDIDIAWSYRRTRQGYRHKEGLPPWLRHRGFTHYPITYLPLATLGCVLPPPSGQMVFAFLLGVASHLVADMLTPTGIPLFSLRRKTRLARIKTGSAVETILALALVGGLFLIPQERYLRQVQLLKAITAHFVG